ncbi:MAG: hypothetical protein AAB527_01050 [Patescibacteria group bacterium]
MSFLETVQLITTSPLTTTILTLLLFFQWHKQHAKEQSVKNSLFALHIILSKKDPSSESLNFLDAVLATLDARPPFQEKISLAIRRIKKGFHEESVKDVEVLSQEAKNNEIV